MKKCNSTELQKTHMLYVHNFVYALHTQIKGEVVTQCRDACGATYKTETEKF